jgi:hypothetical protein
VLNPDSNAPSRRISFIGFVRPGADAVTEFAANLVHLFAEATALNIDAMASIALQMKFIHRGVNTRVSISARCALESINELVDATGQ